MASPTIEKPFRELTTKEAKALVKECARGEHTAEAIKSNLTKAGFHGKSAAIAITTHTHGSMRMSMAMVMVHGPNGEIISC